VATAKQKAVVKADKERLGQVQDLVRNGRYESVSEFFREAVAEKLARVAEGQIAEAVEGYCAAGHAEEDRDLVEAQAFVGEKLPRKSKVARRASR